MTLAREKIRAFCEQSGWDVQAWITAPLVYRGQDFWIAITKDGEGATRFAWSRDGEPLEVSASRLQEHYDSIKLHLDVMERHLKAARSDGI